MAKTLEARVLARLPLFLGPHVAACAGMTVHDLQAVLGGTVVPTAGQWQALGRRMGIKP